MKARNSVDQILADHKRDIARRSRDLAGTIETLKVWKLARERKVWKCIPLLRQAAIDQSQHEWPGSQLQETPDGVTISLGDITRNFTWAKLIF